MSIESVKQFWQKAHADKSLQAKLNAIQEKERQAIIAAVIKLAKEVGFVFTASDYEFVLKEELAREHSAGEMDEYQLNQVAGGGFTVTICNGSNVGTVAPPPKG